MTLESSVKFLAVLLIMLSFQQALSQEAYIWKKQSQETLKKKLNDKVNTNVAKNVILFIGDGMGISTVTAARILKGQLQGKSGEETVLEFENFPHVALSKTYSIDKQTSGSAETATALLSGIKTNYDVIGVDGKSKFNDCDSIKNAKVDSMLDWSELAGKSTGIVTNTRITHATPASAYAHTPHRKWEGDASMELYNADKKDCKDIAYQLIKENPNIEVILGGGRRYFLPNNTIDPETKTLNSELGRRDGLDLIEMWKDDKMKRGFKHNYVWNNEDFCKVDPEQTDFLLGLFQDNHMQHALDRDSSPKGEPSLAEMTRKAIQILRKNDNGFFLLVEGGQIDIAHHHGHAKHALHETLDLEEAVKKARELTNDDDTLIIVTADHSHVFNIAGEPKRGNDIFGIVDPVASSYAPLDGKAFTTLLYANGPGYNMSGRNDPRDELERLGHKDYIVNGGVPMKKETHGGEDVAIYANGPMAHLIHGVQEQNYVAHVMAYAACVGQNKDHCRQNTNSGSIIKSQMVIVFIIVARLFI